jgi:hypothetical protein
MVQESAGINMSSRAGPFLGVLLLTVLGAVMAVATVSAEDPPTVPAVTETVVQEVLVVQRIRGRGVHYWHHRAKTNYREMRQYRRTLKRLVRSSPYGTYWLERALLCIHAHEGRWDGRDFATGSTYFGGLQMDHDFQRAYGAVFYRAWGTADRWPVSAQLATGMVAYLSGRGFGPWPTRTKCGL